MSSYSLFSCWWIRRAVIGDISQGISGKILWNTQISIICGRLPHENFPEIVLTVLGVFPPLPTFARKRDVKYVLIRWTTEKAIVIVWCEDMEVSFIIRKGLLQGLLAGRDRVSEFWMESIRNYICNIVNHTVLLKEKEEGHRSALPLQDKRL